MMKVLSLLIVGLVVAAVVLAIVAWAVTDEDTKIEAWEQGFKTSHVVATRYKSPMIGYNIGFKYTDQRYDDKGDRGEVMDFFQSQHCTVVQGGGGPYSEYFVICSDVTDRQSANIKMETLLPALDRFVGAL